MITIVSAKSETFAQHNQELLYALKSGAAKKIRKKSEIIFKPDFFQGNKILRACLDELGREFLIFIKTFG